jgi:phospholipase/carboxylesterase
MRILDAGPLRVRALGGTDRQGGGTGPSVVLLHGYGVPANDLVLLPRRIRAGVGLRWFFPEGPLSIGDTAQGQDELARAWYPVDHVAIQERLAAGLSPYPETSPVPPGLDQALAQLAACLAALASEHDVAPERTIVGGFSQGAVMATELVLQQRPLFAGAALLSGRLLDPARLDPSLRELGASLHVFQSHGAADTVIPMANGLALRDVLAAHGASLQWFRYEGAHAITSEVHPALAAFCQSRLFPAPAGDATSL